MTMGMRHPGEFELPSLTAWMRKRFPDVGETLQARAIAGGQSNPTFALGNERPRWVLRKQPAGQLLPSAHAIDREFRIQKALEGTGVPVPRMLAYCDDRSVIGSPFYLMEWVEGRVMPDYALPDIPESQRRSYYTSMATTLATLHCVDWAAAGLADFGRPGNFFERQIARWSRQWAASSPGSDTQMERLIGWLRAHIPSEEKTTIVHGDFRMGNLMFHPTEPTVVAVLDWELSTLGNPLADAAFSAMAWHMLPAEFNGLRNIDLAGHGIPTQAEYLSEYAAASGGAESVTAFHLAFSMFRFSVILAGVASRARQGNAAGEDAEAVGNISSAFAREAMALL